MTSSTSTAALLPDESLRIFHLDNRLVVLSVSEKGVSIGQGADYHDLDKADFKKGYHFFTENLGLTSSVRAPSGLSLCTWRLSCPPESAANSISISTTGDDGDDDAKYAKDYEEDEKPKKGRDGHNGGTLLLYAQDLDDNTAKAVVLTARGGRGGNASKTNVVGDGGDGGLIRSVIQPTYVQVLNLLLKYFDRAEFHPSDTAQYQTKVVAGDSLYSEAKSIVLKSGVLNAPRTIIDSVFKPLADEIHDIDQKKDRTILDVKRAVNKVKKPLKKLVSEQKFQVASIVDDVRGGYPGRGIDKDVPAGRQGEAGENSQIFLETWTPSDLAQAKLPFVHPEQCTMLLQRANLFFYMNSPMLRSYARLIYQRLIVRLSFLPLGSDDPLRKAYNDSLVMPKTSIEDLEKVLAAAKEQLLHVDSDLNFNGYTPRWVPRRSYDAYKQSVTEAYDALVRFEEAYTKYNTALNEQKDLNDDLKLAYDNTSKVVNSLQADITDLTELIATLERKINELTPGVLDAKDELIKACRAEESAIKSSFGLNVNQIISALTMTCFSPKLLGGIETGYLVYQGFTEVPNMDGTTIRKEYLASAFQQCQAQIETIGTKLEKKINGEYTLDDPFALRLIVEKEQLLHQLDQFSHEAFGGVQDTETRKALETKFNAYIDAVTARNDEILSYNVTVKKLCERQTDQAAYKGRQTELAKRKVKNTDPDLAAITAYVGRVYQASQARMLKLLDLLVRSLNFRMLLHSDIYNYGLGGTDPGRPSDLDNVPLTLSATALDDIRQTISSKFDHITEHWGGEPSKFPPNFDNTQGKRYYLSKYELRSLLNADSPTVTVTIPTVKRESKTPEDFRGCCNVRIYRVRFGLDGLKTASDLKKDEDALVKFSMTHMGLETIVDRTNASFTFEHDPVNSQFSYRLKQDCTATLLDNGNIGECNVNETATSYAAPGPFARWIVSMVGTEFSKLDVGKVTKAYFDFCGTNYGYLVPKKTA